MHQSLIFTSIPQVHVITKLFILHHHIMIAAVGVDPDIVSGWLEFTLRTFSEVYLEFRVRYGVLLDLLWRQTELVDFRHHRDLRLLLIVLWAFYIGKGTILGFPGILIDGFLF